ncbi:MAG: hypothetical protein M3Y85_10310, partial [Bacteroidota bacterium]|nr:hypothetical protein [Bacteroidota bacterium]
YCHSAEQRILLSTDIAIPQNYWNKKTGRIAENLPLQYGTVNQLQKILTEKLRKAEDMVEHAVKKRNACPMQFLKENFSLQQEWQLEQMSDSKKSLDVYWNIDDYVSSKLSTVKHCTINVINAMKAHLQSFENHRKEPITFDSFDVIFMKPS